MKYPVELSPLTLLDSDSSEQQLDCFDGLSCPPLDFDAMTFDLSSKFYDGIYEQLVAGFDYNEEEKKAEDYPEKPMFGKGKHSETVLRALNQPPPRQDWEDEDRLESSKRKLRQAYHDTQNKRRKIQIIEIRNLPKPPKVPKPRRGYFNKNKCLAF